MRLEYFLQEINGWVCLDMEEYINLNFSLDDSRIRKINSINNVPIKIIHDNNQNWQNIEIISGNYVEVLIKKEINLTVKSPKKISITMPNKNNNQKIYDIWVVAKIIYYEYNTDVLSLFWEYNEEIIIINGNILNKIRPLSQPKILQDDISIFYIKKLSNNEYVKFKSEYEMFENQIEEEKEYLLYQNFDLIKSSLLFVCPKSEINSFTFLKEYEDKYKNINNDDFYPNSGITSRSGITEESEKKENKHKSENSKILIIEDEDFKLNEINKYEFKKSFLYNSLFYDDAKREVENNIKKNKYYITSIDHEEFKIIIYGNNEKDFKEEISYFGKEYKSQEIKTDSNINKNEMIDTAKAANLKIYFGNQFIYLIGEEKSFLNFEALINMNEMYSKEFQKSYREKDNIQKQLTNFKKEHKIK